MTGSTQTRTRVRVRGLVQGVGFRPFVYRLAQRHHLTGWVRNDEQGVLFEVQGDCGGLLHELRDEKPPLARIDAVEAQPVAPEVHERGFVIDASARTGRAKVAIGPDHAPCKDCLEELFDPTQRRYRYPFLNCTHCGPRYTITFGLPYDRPQTSMARFPMCLDCAGEYADPQRPPLSRPADRLPALRPARSRCRWRKSPAACARARSSRSRAWAVSSSPATRATRRRWRR